ncbi:MAG TPA: hypothetical protein VJC12_01075 [Candidatus Paceibacterota bacterium]
MPEEIPSPEEVNQMRSASEIERLSGKVMAVRGNRHGPRSTLRAIWTVLDEEGLTEPEERNAVLVQISDHIGLEKREPTLPSVTKVSDERHENTWQRRLERRQDGN